MSEGRDVDDLLAELLGEDAEEDPVRTPLQAGVAATPLASAQGRAS